MTTTKSSLLQFYELAWKLLNTLEIAKGYPPDSYWPKEVDKAREEIAQLIAHAQGEHKPWKRHVEYLENFIASKDKDEGSIKLSRDAFLQKAFEDLTRSGKQEAWEIYDKLALQNLGGGDDYFKHCVVRIIGIDIHTSCGNSPKGARVTIDVSCLSAIEGMHNRALFQGIVATIYGPQPVFGGD